MSKRKVVDFSYTNDNGKRVSGSAAFNHYVYTNKGSVEVYNDEVARVAIEEFFHAYPDLITEGLDSVVKKSKFKVV